MGRTSATRERRGDGRSQLSPVDPAPGQLPAGMQGTQPWRAGVRRDRRSKTGTLVRGTRAEGAPCGAARPHLVHMGQLLLAPQVALPDLRRRRGTAGAGRWAGGPARLAHRRHAREPAALAGRAGRGRRRQAAHLAIIVVQRLQVLIHIQRAPHQAHVKGACSGGRPGAGWVGSRRGGRGARTPLAAPTPGAHAAAAFVADDRRAWQGRAQPHWEPPSAHGSSQTSLRIPRLPCAASCLRLSQWRRSGAWRTGLDAADAEQASP